jgi:hypothetical protein
MSKSKLHEVGPLACTTSRKISGLVFKSIPPKTTISRLSSGLGNTPGALIPSRAWFKTVDRVWTGYPQRARDGWNRLGRRRHKRGYWVHMSYYLKLKWLHFLTDYDPPYPENLEPKP